MSIRYLKGDATNPQASGLKVIAHVCNDLGRWGKGFVMAVSKKWPETRREYVEWYKKGQEENFALGEVQYVILDRRQDIIVANMVGQRGIYASRSQGPPIRYDALEKCLKNLGEFATSMKASVHMPKIGCGLAGGKWEKIEPLILKHLEDIEVTVYEL